MAGVLGVQSPPLQDKTLAHRAHGRCQVEIAMSRGEKSGFKLRRREVDPAVETAPEITRELFRVATLGARQIDDGLSREEETKHRAHSMKGPRHREISQ